MAASDTSLTDPIRRHEALQAALDLIDQGFTLIDSDLRMVAWNRSFLRLLDFPPAMGHVGAPFESFMRYNAERGEYGSGDPEQYIASRMRAARNFEPHEFERTRPDGTVLRIKGVPVPGHGFVTLYSDVTAQRRAEQQIQQHAAQLEQRVAERTAELLRSEAQMRLITDSIPALVGYFDRQRRYRYINRGYQSWFGLDPARPEAASARQVLGEATYAAIRPMVARALAGEPVHFEYETDTVAGARVVARTTLIPERAADGQVAGCFELTFDITEQKRAQAMLVQAQKMEALGQLTGGLAHDFNNLLTVIIGNLGALCRARPGDPAVAEFVEPAMDAARRGADLIKGLLSFARRQPLEAQATDVVPLIAAVGRLVRRSLPDSLQLRIDTGDAPLWAWVDPNQLQNSLLNLILNARDATRAQGCITLCAEARPLDAGQAEALQVEPGRGVCIEVRDDGCGMDAATLARVFEPFFSTKRPGLGTGLGMAMVYGFARQSGGAVRIASQPGKGTTVRLWLPACELAADQQPEAEFVAEPGPGDQGLALLVEDEPEVRKVVRRNLLDLGYSVLEAENGGEALQILEQTPGITLLLSDVVMPGGVDGRQLARHARSVCRVPQVVLMSGYTPGPGAAGDEPVLAKPFTASQLAAWLAASAP
ncbi:MAG: PAS-domain containing protein [Burkholderiaceae bacterium]|nr:PAS-domain containing protein [Burkholderiaceae bacterium]